MKNEFLLNGLTLDATHGFHARSVLILGDDVDVTGRMLRGSTALAAVPVHDFNGSSHDAIAEAIAMIEQMPESCDDRPRQPPPDVTCFLKIEQVELLSPSLFTKLLDLDDWVARGCAVALTAKSLSSLIQCVGWKSTMLLCLHFGCIAKVDYHTVAMRMVAKYEADALFRVPLLEDFKYPKLFEDDVFTAP